MRRGLDAGDYAYFYDANGNVGQLVDWTANVIESPFAGVRLRTNAAKRFKKTKSGVCLVHQVLLRLSQTWRPLKSAHLCGQVPLSDVKKNRAKTKSHAA